MEEASCDPVVLHATDVHAQLLHICLQVSPILISLKVSYFELSLEFRGFRS